MACASELPVAVYLKSGNRRLHLFQRIVMVTVVLFLLRHCQDVDAQTQKLFYRWARHKSHRSLHQNARVSSFISPVAALVAIFRMLLCICITIAADDTVTFTALGKLVIDIPCDRCVQFAVRFLSCFPLHFWQFAQVYTVFRRSRLVSSTHQWWKNVSVPVCFSLLFLHKSFHFQALFRPEHKNYRTAPFFQSCPVFFNYRLLPLLVERSVTSW